MDTVYYRRQLLAAPVFTATLIALVQLVTLSLHPRFFPVPPVARPSNAERSRKRVPPPRPLSRAEAASIRRKFDSDCDAIGNELSRREFSSAWKKRNEREKKSVPGPDSRLRCGRRSNRIREIYWENFVASYSFLIIFATGLRNIMEI